MAEKTCCLLGGAYVFNPSETMRYALKSIKFLIEQRGVTRFCFCAGGQSVRLMLKVVFAYAKRGQKGGSKATNLPKSVEIINYKSGKNFYIRRGNFAKNTRFNAKSSDNDLEFTALGNEFDAAFNADFATIGCSGVGISEILTECNNLGDFTDGDLAFKMLADSDFCISYVPLVFEGEFFDKPLCAAYYHAFKNQMKICNLSVSPEFFGDFATVE